LFRSLVLLTVAVVLYYGSLHDTFNLRRKRAPVSGVPEFCKTAGQVAMTFDEGPSTKTLQVLNALKRAQALATFHITTQYLNNVAVLTNAVTAKESGHIIGLRFPTDPSNLSDEQFQQALLDQSQRLKDSIGVFPKFLRLPYGKVKDNHVAIANCMGFVITQWNIDTLDYELKPTATDSKLGALQQAYGNAFAGMNAGGGRFISLHRDLYDVYLNETVLVELTKYIKAYGYNLVTLDKCLSEASPYRSENTACNGGSGQGPVAGGDGKQQGQSSDAIRSALQKADFMVLFVVLFAFAVSMML